MEILVSMGLILNQDGQILGARRSESMAHPLKWEFPGGKIQEGENPQSALLRELEEELGIKVQILYPLRESLHFYGSTRIRFFPFLCSLQNQLPLPLEHRDIAWFEKERLPYLNWVEADLAVLRDFLEFNLLPLPFRYL